MGDVRLGRRRDRGDMVNGRREILRPALVDFRQEDEEILLELLRIPELLEGVPSADLGLEALQLLLGLAIIDELRLPEMLVVDHEEHDRNPVLDRPVVLHLGDRDIRALGHEAVAMREDPEVDRRLVDLRQADLDRLSRVGAELLHRNRQQAQPLADVDRDLAIFPQILLRAADEDLVDVGHLNPSLPKITSQRGQASSVSFSITWKPSFRAASRRRLSSVWKRCPRGKPPAQRSAAPNCSASAARRGCRSRRPAAY